MAAKIDVLTKQRALVRSKITKLGNLVDSSIDSWDSLEKRKHITKAKDLQQEILNFDEQILTISIANGETDQQLEVRSEASEHYTDALLSIITVLECPASVSSIPSPQSSGASSSRPAGTLKLPPVELPKFANGKDENLSKFLNILDSILDKYSHLSEHQKFLLLQGQLSGAPRILVETLDFDNHTYSEAKDALRDAFDSSAKSTENLIDLLSSLKMGDGEEPYKYIGKFRTITSGAKTLKLSSDDFVRHFVWKGFNPAFQNHLVAITNKANPSLSEIQTHLFEAADRYVKNLNQSKQDIGRPRSSAVRPKETVAMATNVQRKTHFCNLCKSDKKPADHHISKCPVYETGKSKCDKLRKLKSCMKCSFSNHETSACRFKFKSNCRICGGEHFGYLCWKPQKTSVNEILVEDSSENETNVYNSIATYNTSVKNLQILPTFTAQVNCDENKRVSLRAFKDGGSQTSFICRSVADYHKFPVVRDHVNITIRGFNSSKRITTKIVRISLTFGEKTFSQDVICVDEIRTQFRSDGMGELVSAFSEKGYSIADHDYDSTTSGTVDNIDLVLGSDTDHMIAMQYHTFGDPNDIDNNSSYIETSIGVVFSGNIKKMLSNLKFLKSNNEEYCCNSVITSYPYIFTEHEPVPFLEPHHEECQSFHMEINSNTCQSDDSGDQIEISFSPNIPELISELNDEKLMEACQETLGISEECDSESETDTNMQLVDYVLKNSEYDSENFLKMPLLWNNRCAHLLAKNYNLAKRLLESNFKKLSQNPEKLRMYNQVFKEQEDLGIIERINDLDTFLLMHPEASFLCHMGVFRMSHESTKCRVVFLSNMAEKFNGGISHNSAMLPGPNLNHRLSTAIILNRFNKFLISFDIKKAFLAIKLFERDSSRLLFLWYRNIENSDFTIIGFRNLRLSFGLRNSPAILMLGLYKVLILDHSGDERLDDIRREIWNGIYMDNGCYSCHSEQELMDSYGDIKNIFESKQLLLQQFFTNSPHLQNSIDAEYSIETPNDVKFLGLNWNRSDDTLSPKAINLDKNANTKRTVLSSLNSIHDLFGLYTPMLLRARIFMQKVLTMYDNWDEKFSPEVQSEWVLICKSVNAVPVICIPRFIGRRDGNFCLITMTDASKDAYGCIVYIKDLDTNVVSYVTARTRLVNTAAAKRTIPSLEFQAIAYGVEVMQELYGELTGSSVVVPINIAKCYLFTDSMICLHWLLKYSFQFDKLQSLSVFVKNRLRYVTEVCARMETTFHHVAGMQNTADYLTRPTSYKLLSRTEYYAGPSFLSSNLDNFLSDLIVSLPNPVCTLDSEVADEICCDQVVTDCTPTDLAVTDSNSKSEPLLRLENFSKFNKAVGTLAHVMLFIEKLKRKVGNKTVSNSNTDLFRKCYERATNFLIINEQKNLFQDVYAFLESPSKRNKDIPALVNKYNLYRDEKGVLRVKSKLPKSPAVNPILLGKSSTLTSLVIRQTHESLGHRGVFSVMRELRKTFWVESCMSAVKKCLKKCVVCKRLHERTVRINQNSYRAFRHTPTPRCFRSVFLDHIGPFNVNLQGKRTKIWILIVTCLFSRATSLKICMNLSVKEFLKALQMHCHDFGMFGECISDLGSSLQAGANTIHAFLSDHETQRFLGLHGIKRISFSHYAKGNSALGSLVESIVKQVKLLIQKSVKSNVLEFFDFQFLISEATNIINKRPIAFKEQLCSLSPDEVPTCITPEMLMRGTESPTLNIIPQLQADEHPQDPEYNETLGSTYEKLKRVRAQMIENYHHDFLVNIIAQATDKPERYKPVLHKTVNVGDIVLLVDKFLKQYQYPMGRVLSVERNSLNETTSAKIWKGDSKEVVFRHVTSLIPLISGENVSCIEEAHKKLENASGNTKTSGSRPKTTRAAAKAANAKMKTMSLN